MSLNLMGKKRGMTKIFDEEGYIVPCTVIEIEPNVVTQIKTVETDGYNAIQTAYETVTAKDPRRKEKRYGLPDPREAVRRRQRLGQTRELLAGQLDAG